MIRILLVASAIVLSISNLTSADIVHFEGFESDGGYSTNIAEFTDNANDFFLRTNGTNINGNVIYKNVQGNSFFAAQDIDGEGATLPAQLTINGIDISGYANLQFSGMFAEDEATDGFQDWESSDYVRIYYRIDGGSYQDLMWFGNNGGGTSAPMLDLDFDSVGDGAVVTETFTAFTAAIVGTGATLDLMVEFQLNGADEDFAIDSFTISTTAIPEPGFMGLLGLAAISLLARRRPAVK